MGLCQRVLLIFTNVSVGLTCCLFMGDVRLVEAQQRYLSTDCCIDIQLFKRESFVFMINLVILMEIRQSTQITLNN